MPARRRISRIKASVAPACFQLSQSGSLGLIIFVCLSSALNSKTWALPQLKTSARRPIGSSMLAMWGQDSIIQNSKGDYRRPGISSVCI